MAAPLPSCRCLVRLRYTPLLSHCRLNLALVAAVPRRLGQRGARPTIRLTYHVKVTRPGHMDDGMALCPALPR